MSLPGQSSPFWKFSSAEGNARAALRLLLGFALFVTAFLILRGCPLSEQEERERVESLFRLKLPLDARIIYRKRQDRGDIYHIEVPRASFPLLSASRRQDYSEWAPVPRDAPRFGAGELYVRALSPGATFSHGAPYKGRSGGGFWPVLIWHEDRELLIALVCNAQGG